MSAGGVPMRQALDDDGCEIVLKFFAMLLHAQELNNTDKKINVGDVLDAWNQIEFGHAKQGLSFSRSDKRQSWYSRARSDYDYRRDFLAEKPDLAVKEAATLWDITENAARNWMFRERDRQRRAAS